MIQELNLYNFSLKKKYHDYYLVTDSRSVFDPSRTIFAALRTEVGDGHRYIRSLIDSGVKTFFVEYIPQGVGESEADFFITDSVERALREMAYARVRGNENGVVITGSRGKTTVKELLFRVLRSVGVEVVRSPGSWNSALGVALSLWDMSRGNFNKETVLITEAAIDGPRQARRIVDSIANSHKIGVITDITDEHDEAFSSHREKIREKLDILSSCSRIVYNQSDPVLREEVEKRFSKFPYKAIPVDPSHLPSGCPTIFHAIVAEILRQREEWRPALENLFDIPLVSTRIDITETSNGNVILRDHFTPDLRSLRIALDTSRRHLTESQKLVLIAGKLIDSGENEIRELAALFGVDEVIFVRNFTEFSDRFNIDSFSNSLILVFGAKSDGFDDIAVSLSLAVHDSILEVDLDALVHNYNYYRSLVPPGTGIIAMVKASAYGLGAVEVGKTLQSSGAAALAVAVVDEGIELRQGGISMPVIVLNPVTNRYQSLFSNRLEPAVFSLEALDRLIAEARSAGVEQYPIHIKLDTGMHRVGFIEEGIDALIERLNREDASAVRVASVFSHLATADCLDMDQYTRGQIELFHKMTRRLKDGLGYDFKRHILNTAGMMRFADCGEYEMVRLGIGLYGVAPYDGPEKDSLRTIASLKTRIISLKHWPAGTTVGYGCRGVVSRPSVIATIPIGYADGINRHLGRGNISFMVHGVECPTVGNICMDLCMIDVTEVKDVSVGDIVEIFGTSMPIERISKVLDTIPYEILTSVSPRVHRNYFRH